MGELLCCPRGGMMTVAHQSLVIPSLKIIQVLWGHPFWTIKLGFSTSNSHQVVLVSVQVWMVFARQTDRPDVLVETDPLSDMNHSHVIIAYAWEIIWVLDNVFSWYTAKQSTRCVMVTFASSYHLTASKRAGNTSLNPKVMTVTVTYVY